MTDDRLVKAEELAEAIGMGLSSIYKLASAGKIPSYSAGPGLTGVRFSISEVKAALRRPYRQRARADKTDCTTAEVCQ
ncbi:MAG: hypothetical protein OJF50_006280 [Nitrospira sp.]|jgi:excisionase family DNA binding protein|nr:hypothetical protein [Nitrospira sp.]